MYRYDIKHLNVCTNVLFEAHDLQQQQQQLTSADCYQIYIHRNKKVMSTTKWKRHTKWRRPSLPALLCVIIALLSIAAVRIRSAIGFVVKVPSSSLPRILSTKRMTIILPTREGRVPRFQLKNNVDDNTSTSTFVVVNSDDDIRFNNDNASTSRSEAKDDDDDDDDDTSNIGSIRTIHVPSKMSSNSSIISDAAKRVMTAAVLLNEEEGDGDGERQSEQGLVLPVHKTKTNQYNDLISNALDNKNRYTNDNENDNNLKLMLKRRRRSITKLYRRLRPGQKFRLRLVTAALLIASFWNIIAVQSGGTYIGIMTILRKWLSHRGFQGLAAAGRSCAYLWALLVAYPRMLDKRSKERRRKREDEMVDRWRNILRNSSEEIVRLNRELSILEKEMRTFRREILAIRAARVNNNNIDYTKRNNENDAENKNNHSRIEENEELKLIREVILQEMNQLTRLRDDTRTLLTASRKRYVY